MQTKLKESIATLVYRQLLLLTIDTKYQIWDLLLTYCSYMVPGQMQNSGLLLQNNQNTGKKFSEKKNESQHIRKKITYASIFSVTIALDY